MILTITPNPSIDTTYSLDKFNLDQVNRCSKITKTPGGKGINVAKVLKLLGTYVTATGIIGGYNGMYINDALKEMGIDTDFVNTNINTRNCINITYGDKNTEILENSEAVDKSSIKKFEEILKTYVNKANIVTISGSLMTGMDYKNIFKILEIFKNSKVILDTSGEPLKKVLQESKIRPYAIKPNEDELKALTGKEINSTEDIKLILENRLFKDIPLIMVSLGSKGAYVKFQEKSYIAKIPKIKLISPVGSGDSTVAGIAYELDRQSSIEDIIKTSMTCGILNAMEYKTGHINTENYEKIRKEIQVKEI